MPPNLFFDTLFSKFIPFIFSFSPILPFSLSIFLLFFIFPDLNFINLFLRYILVLSAISFILFLGYTYFFTVLYFYTIFCPSSLGNFSFIRFLSWRIFLIGITGYCGLFRWAQSFRPGPLTKGREGREAEKSTLNKTGIRTSTIYS